MHTGWARKKRTEVDEDERLSGNNTHAHIQHTCPHTHNTHTGWAGKWSTEVNEDERLSHTRTTSECLREAVANGPSVELPWVIVNYSKFVF
jgi:hypothetical protein